MFGFNVQDKSRETITSPLLQERRHFGWSFTLDLLKIVPASAIAEGWVLEPTPWLNCEIRFQKREVSIPIRPIIGR